MNVQPSEEVRTLTTEVSIDAPVEAVWQALTDADELKRWFPLDARVKAGTGGSIWLSWGPPWEGESTIEIWEPNRRLKNGWQMAGEFQKRSPIPISVEYALESNKGRTVLRLVHTGFGRDASWDREFDGVSRGWAFELGSLKHYLEHHRGEDREVIWLRLPASGEPSQVMPTMVGADAEAFRGRINNLGIGDPYSLILNGLNELTGKVVANRPPRLFAGTVDKWNNALLRLEMERGEAGEEIWCWISTFGVSPERRDAIRSAAAEAITRAIA